MVRFYNHVAFTSPSQGHHTPISHPQKHTHIHTLSLIHTKRIKHHDRKLSREHWLLSKGLGRWGSRPYWWMRKWGEGKVICTCSSMKNTKALKGLYSTHTYTHTQRCQHAYIVCNSSKRLTSSFIYNTLHFVCIGREGIEIESAWVLEGGVAQCYAQVC